MTIASVNSSQNFLNLKELAAKCVAWTKQSGQRHELKSDHKLNVCR